MKQAVPVGLIVIGALVLALGFVLPMLSSPRPGLSPEKYDELEVLENRVVDLYQQIERIKQRTGRSANAEEASVGYNAAVARRDELRAELAAGISSPKTTGRVMTYTGVGLLAVGAVASLAMKQSG